ncbi:UNVERIFIED_CONTAM: Serine/threonine-protein kinase phg2 [Sesamum radiatum]|uniref:Serine/threonine-protein kinase phg2 n=1 Tax=Sesamum radiatum TaxID=300843 RepID=A0AAW2PJI7_SESRA
MPLSLLPKIDWLMSWFITLVKRCLQNLRPEIPRCCPSSLANVMKRCWDANPDKRPEMDEVVSMLEAIDTSKGGGMIPVDQQQGCLCFRKYRGP